MILKYIFHSSFLIEMDNCNIIFDYFKGDLPEFDRSKKLYVFSTHGHPDHFDEKIFDIFSDVSEVEYLLSDDIEELEVEGIENKKNVHFLATRKSYVVGDMKIDTLESTDLGIAVSLEIEGKKIYHSGDLHWWTWEGFETEEEYQIMTDRYKLEIGQIKDSEFDLAMLVLDPRQQSRYDWGMKYFIENTNTKYLAPMHCWEKYEVIEKFKKDNRELADSVIIINTPETTLNGFEII